MAREEKKMARVTVIGLGTLQFPVTIINTEESTLRTERQLVKTKGQVTLYKGGSTDQGGQSDCRETQKAKSGVIGGRNSDHF